VSLRDIEGTLDARGLRVAVVCARFNDFIVGSLLRGACESWAQRGGDPGELVVVRVPGAFELPVAARRLAASGGYSAVVALGCVIRGDTPHFDYVAGEAARGIGQAALETGVPVIFGVLTVDNVDQAIERAATSRMNKGGEAMDVAIEMADLFRRI
jgi:6,7-dimethyl-8-ribityllumazine synthase